MDSNDNLDTRLRVICRQIKYYYKMYHQLFIIGLFVYICAITIYSNGYSILEDTGGISQLLISYR